MSHPYREAPPVPVEKRPFPLDYVVAGLVAIALVAMFAFKTIHREPRPATIDCATGQVIDDGCVNGVCVAGANACGVFK